MPATFSDASPGGSEVELLSFRSSSVEASSLVEGREPMGQVRERERQLRHGAGPRLARMALLARRCSSKHMRTPSSFVFSESSRAAPATPAAAAPGQRNAPGSPVHHGLSRRLAAQDAVLLKRSSRSSSLAVLSTTQVSLGTLPTLCSCSGTCDCIDASTATTNRAAYLGSIR